MDKYPNDEFNETPADSQSDQTYIITSNSGKSAKLHRRPLESPTNSDHEYYDVKEEPDNSQLKAQCLSDDKDIKLVINEPELSSRTSGTKISHTIQLKMLARLSRFSLNIHRISINKYKSPLVTTQIQTFTKPKNIRKPKGNKGSGRTRTRAEFSKQNEIEENVMKDSLKDLPLSAVPPIEPIPEIPEIEIPLISESLSNIPSIQPETSSIDNNEFHSLTEDNVVPENQSSSPHSFIQVSIEICNTSQRESITGVDSPKHINSPPQIPMDDSPPQDTSPIQNLIYDFDNSPECVISPLQSPIDDSRNLFSSPPQSPTINRDDSQKQLDSLSIIQYADEDIINIRVSPTLFPDSPTSNVKINEVENDSSKNHTPISNLHRPHKKMDFHWTPIHFRQQQRQRSPNSNSDDESPKERSSKTSPSRKITSRKSPRRGSRHSPLKRSPCNSPSRRSPKRSPRDSPSKRSPKRSPRNSPSKRSPKRSPRNSPSKRSPRRSPRNSPSRRSPRSSPRRTSRRSPRRSPMRSSSRRSPLRRSPRRSPRYSPSRRSPRYSPSRRSPRYSPSRRSPRRSPFRRRSRSPGRSSRSSPSRRSPNRRSPPRRSPIPSSHSGPSPLRSPHWSSRRSPYRRSPIPYKSPPARRSPYRDRPALGSPPRSGMRSPPRGRPLYRSSSRSLSRSPVRRPSRFGSPARHQRGSPHRLQGRLSPGLIDHHRDRTRSPVWDFGPIRTINDRSTRSKSPAKISINLPSRLRDRNMNQDEKKIVRVDSPISMSISPQTSTQEDDADTMRIVSRSSIRNRITLSPMRAPHVQRSRSSSPIIRPFHMREEFFDRDSLSPKYPEETREFFKPSSPKNTRISKLPIVSYNYNPEIDTPANTSQQSTIKSEPDEFSPFSILENMFKDKKVAQSDISKYLPTEDYISKELPLPLPFEPDKDPTLIPFTDRTVICPLCKSVLYAKRYELHVRAKCIFRSQLTLNPPSKPTESVPPEVPFVNELSQDSMNTMSADNYSLTLIQPVEQRPFKCPDKICEHRGLIPFLRDHYEQMHLSFNCFNCKQRIIDPNTFPNHLSKCQTKSPIVCPLCVIHYPLLNSYSLGHHILNQHSSEMCVICKQQMSWKYYTAHVLRCMFNSQHRYRCPICNGSVRLDTIADHMLTKHYRDACAVCKRMTGNKPIVHVSKCFLDVTGMSLNYIQPENKVRCTMCSFQSTFFDIASHYLKSHPFTKCVFCENIFDIKEFANHIGICCQIHDGIPKAGLIHIYRPPVLSNPPQLSASDTFKHPIGRRGFSATSSSTKFGTKPSYITTQNKICSYPFNIDSQRPFINTSTQPTIKQIGGFPPAQQRPARPSKFSNRKL